MTAIAASQVKELRERTGAGMMECKNALVETGGDIDAAVKLLREKGMASAGKRASRETTEGVVGHRRGGTTGTLVAVGCETEPVSKNDEFQAFAHTVLETVEERGPDAAADLEEERIELIAKLGENIVVRGAERYEAGEGEEISVYVHPPANKIGVMVKTKGGSPETARFLAMHVSFARPRYMRRDQVPAADVAAEREIYEKQPDVQSKPDEVRGKIVEGMLNKRFFAETVLADQPWIHEPSLTVEQALAREGLELVDFVRYDVGE